MAENRFGITLTAVDKASKVIDGVNKNVNKLFRPLDNAKKSTRSFLDTLGRNDLIKRPLRALDTIGKGVTGIGQAFGVAESSVLGSTARIAASLGAMGGPIGGFLAGTAALVGGVTAVGVRMGQFGFNVSRTAKNLNVTTDQLQEYRGAAKQAGLQTEAMDSSLGALATNLSDADAGLNQPLSNVLALMHIGIKRTKDGAVDTIAAVREISDVVSHMSDQTQARRLTDMLGVTELLPLLREGTQKLDQYIATAHKVGDVMGPQQIAKLEQQGAAWNRTKEAVDGAANSVGNLIAQYARLDEVAASTTRVAASLSKFLGKRDEEKKNEPASSGSPLWDWISGRRSLGSAAMSSASSAVPFGMSPKGIFDIYDRARSGWNSVSGGAVPVGRRSASGTITDSSGALVTGSSGAMGLRQNNPGNLRSWPGAGSAGGFARFQTPELGIMAMAKNLAAYQDKYGINTVSGIVNRWAPPADHNDTPAYVADVSKQTGYGPDQRLDLHDPRTLAPLVSAITRHENGQNPYSPEMIAQAVAAAMRDSQGSGDRPIRLVVSNVPAGMTVKVATSTPDHIGLAFAPGSAN